MKAIGTEQMKKRDHRFGEVPETALREIESRSSSLC